MKLNTELFSFDIERVGFALDVFVINSAYRLFYVSYYLACFDKVAFNVLVVDTKKWSICVTLIQLYHLALVDSIEKIIFYLLQNMHILKYKYFFVKKIYEYL